MNLYHLRNTLRRNRKIVQIKNKIPQKSQDAKDNKQLLAKTTTATSNNKAVMFPTVNNKYHSKSLPKISTSSKVNNRVRVSIWVIS